MWGAGSSANDLSPDLVAVTGDLVDGYVDDIRTEVAPVGDLRAPDGVFFVTGNHEYYWDPEAWCAEVQRLGLTVLVNEHRVVERDGVPLVVAGVTDIREGDKLEGHASSPAQAFEGAPEGAFKLLLAHQPRSIHEAARVGAGLMISGHTHGGQFFPWNLLVGLAHPYIRGLHRHGNTSIYVSAGTGYWGPPLRTVPSEITLIELSRARSGDLT